MVLFLSCPPSEAKKKFMFPILQICIVLYIGKLILIQYAFVDSHLLQLYLNYSPQFPLGSVVFSPSRLPHTIHCDFSQRTNDQCNHYLNQTNQESSFFFFFLSLYCDMFTCGNLSCVICRCCQIGGGVIRQQWAYGGLPEWPVGGSM